MSAQTSTVAEATAKFSEWLEKESKVRGASKEARSPDSGSVAAKEWERKAERKGNLVEFLAASPLGVPVSQSMLVEIENVRIDRPASGR